mmetsp:Transcript_22202/g.36787  ORF Transcript_22202/g.36787 Transcript_22202/m.36787 type:complete len:704 (+) Transcript_22202:155-2266(+)
MFSYDDGEIPLKSVRRELFPESDSSQDGGFSRTTSARAVRENVDIARHIIELRECERAIDEWESANHRSVNVMVMAQINEARERIVSRRRRLMLQMAAKEYAVEEHNFFSAMPAAVRRKSVRRADIPRSEPFKHLHFPNEGVFWSWFCRGMRESFWYGAMRGVLKDAGGRSKLAGGEVTESFRCKHEGTSSKSGVQKLGEGIKCSKYYKVQYLRDGSVHLSYYDKCNHPDLERRRPIFDPPVVPDPCDNNCIKRRRIENAAKASQPGAVHPPLGANICSLHPGPVKAPYVQGQPGLPHGPITAMQEVLPGSSVPHTASKVPTPQKQAQVPMPFASNSINPVVARVGARAESMALQVAATRESVRVWPAVVPVDISAENFISASEIEARREARHQAATGAANGNEAEETFDTFSEFVARRKASRQAATSAANVTVAMQVTNAEGVELSSLDTSTITEEQPPLKISGVGSCVTAERHLSTEAGSSSSEECDDVSVRKTGAVELTARAVRRRRRSKVVDSEIESAESSQHSSTSTIHTEAELLSQDAVSSDSSEEFDLGDSDIEAKKKPVVVVFAAPRQSERQRRKILPKCRTSVKEEDNSPDTVPARRKSLRLKRKEIVAGTDSDSDTAPARRKRLRLKRKEIEAATDSDSESEAHSLSIEHTVRKLGRSVQKVQSSVRKLYELKSSKLRVSSFGRRIKPRLGWS